MPGGLRAAAKLTVYEALQPTVANARSVYFCDGIAVAVRKGLQMIALPREVERRAAGESLAKGVDTALARWLRSVLPVSFCVCIPREPDGRRSLRRSEVIERLPLSDGSTLELNTGSKVSYRLSETLRELELTAGEATFGSRVSCRAAVCRLRARHRDSRRGNRVHRSHSR